MNSQKRELSLNRTEVQSTSKEMFLGVSSEHIQN